MGIAERITQIQAEAVARELAAKQEAQRKLQETEAAQLQARALAAEQEAERKATIITELSPLLDAVKTREQLEIVRDEIWQAGEVEQKPTPIYREGGIQYMSTYHSKSNPGLVLRLMAHYSSVESDGTENGGLHVEGDNIYICIGVTDNPPKVSLRSGLSGNDHPVRDNGNYYDSANIPIEQPQVAHDLLEEMLAKACVKLGSVQAFLDSKEGELISYGFKQESIQTIPKPVNERLPWYRKILG